MKGKIVEKTPEVIQNILKWYELGETIEHIARKLEISNKYVRKIIKESNLIRHVVYKKDIDIAKLVQTYLNNKDIEKTAQTFYITITKAKQLIRNEGIYISKSRKQFNWTKFNIIDTEEKAYWLGFIYADGYLSKNGTLSIALNSKDVNHLKKFAQFMECDESYIKNKVQKYNNTEYFSVRLDLSHQQLAQDLQKLGIHAAKSLDLVFPSVDIVPIYLQNHFIRGYFDGDGCVMTKETSSQKLQVSLAGTESFLKSIQECSKTTDKNLIKHKCSKHPIYYLRLKILSSIKFLSYLYTNSTIYLERKKNLWDNFCRSNAEMLRLLEDKIGESWDANTEVIKYVNYIKYRNA